MDSIIISADEIKKQLPGYDPKKSGEYHRESAKKADKKFQKVLKEDTLHKNVVLMSGGPASGKTEFVSEYLLNEGFIVFDGVLPTKEGAKIKLRKIIKNKKEPYVYAVLPDDLKRAFLAFLSRDRKYDDEYFYSKHSSSRATLLWIANNYNNVKINIYESKYTKDQDLIFEKIVFSKKNYRKELIEYLEKIQYTEDEIIKLVN